MYMAITIQDQPSTTYVRPAFAPIEYLLETDTNLTTAVGFKIICKVYFDPTGANTLISTQQLNIKPLTIQAIFSVQDVVKSYVPITYSIPEGDTVDLIENPLSDFKVTFQEYYDSSLQGDIEDSNVIAAYAASPKYIQFASNEWQDYQIATSATEKNFLSGFSNHIPVINAFSAADTFLKVKDTQKLQVQWLQRSATANLQVWFKTLDASFAQVSLSVLDIGTTNKNYFALDIGRQEVGAHTWDTPPVWTNAKSFAIGLYDEHTVDMCSNTYLYELDDCDTNYTNYELHWLNRWGGFDSFVFDGKSDERTTINKTFAKYATDRISGSTLSYTTSAQRTRAFHTGTSESYTLNSRLLYDFEVNGLEDLISSPEVYYRAAEGFVSVNVSGNVYEHSKAENGKVFNLSLNMTIDNSDESQW
jgi:hypothetical protein